MKFTKMHGLGNDYIYVNCLSETIDNPSAVAKKVSDRHFGIGSDGLVLIMPSDVADFRMRMFNSDGSEAEMCGNAVRCVGKYVYDNQLTQKQTVTIETLAGIRILELFVKDGKVEKAKVNMGAPVLTPAEIPVNGDGDAFIAQEVNGRRLTCVSMGNPHAVIYLNEEESLEDLDIAAVGPVFENHPIFPKRANTEFVKVIDATTLKMRVWERGAGETLACGTGACAVLVASVLNGFSQRKATVRLLGGDLEIEWNEVDNCVYMTGSATKVFDGEIAL